MNTSLSIDPKISLALKACLDNTPFATCGECTYDPCFVTGNEEVTKPSTKRLSPEEFTDLTLDGLDIKPEDAWREVLIQMISRHGAKVVETLPHGWRVDTEEFKIEITLKE